MLPRKHRYTLFLGYGTEAESLLKAFEQSKCRLGFNTNILFIKFLLEFHGSNSQPQQHTGWSHRSNEKEEIDALNTIIQNIDVVEDDSSSCQQLNHINFKSDKENVQEHHRNIIKENKEVLVDTTINNSQISPLSETVEKEQQEETLIDTSIDQDVIVDVVQEKYQDDDDLETKNSSSFSDKDKIYEISNRKKILTLSSNLSSTGVLQTEEGKKINENIVFSSPEKLNDIENTTTTKEGENFFSESSKVNDKQNLILKKNRSTAVNQQPKEFLKGFEVIDFKTIPRDSDECRLEQQKKILLLQNMGRCEPVYLNSTKDMLHDFKPAPSNAKYVKHVHDTKSSKNAFTTARYKINLDKF